MEMSWKNKVYLLCALVLICGEIGVLIGKSVTALGWGLLTGAFFGILLLLDLLSQEDKNSDHSRDVEKRKIDMIRSEQLYSHKMGQSFGRRTELPRRQERYIDNRKYLPRQKDEVETIYLNPGDTIEEYEEDER